MHTLSSNIWISFSFLSNTYLIQWYQMFLSEFYFQFIINYIMFPRKIFFIPEQQANLKKLKHCMKKRQITQQIQLVSKSNMTSNYKNFLTSQRLPGHPIASYDSLRRNLVHIYQHVTLQPSNFQSQINSYLNRKESYSGHVLSVSKIKDEQIVYQTGRAAMQVSVVTDYVPWRLHLQCQKLSFEQALFLLIGACKGFRQLLHRVRTPFIIQNSMIGIDGNGNVKVWWNQLFHKSNFGFMMIANIKIESMVKSLINAIVGKTDISAGFEMEDLIKNHSETFAVLEERLEEISKGINMKKNIGKDLISKNQEHIIIMKQCKTLWNVKENSILDTSRLSTGSGKAHFSSQKLILSPRKPEALEFDKKTIVKRVYRDGTSPNANEKMKIIKEDIQQLRSVIERNEPLSAQSRLRSSKSVQSLFSIRKSVNGDITIPEVKKVIASSEMIESPDCTVSRFIQPPIESTTSIAQQNLIHSQLYLQNNQTSPQLISKLHQLGGQDKSAHSTSRSINDSKLEKKMSTESNRQKFGESEKKISENVYFTSFFEA